MAQAPSKKICSTRRYNVKYNENWSKEFPFITASSTDREHANCTICETDFSISHGGRSDITKHKLTAKHTMLTKKNTSGLFALGFTSEKGDSGSAKETARLKAARERDEQVKQVTHAELCFNSFLIEHNIPLAAADHAGDLFRKMFPTCVIAGEYASARTKSTATSKCVADFKLMDLRKKLAVAPFSIATDGSNDKDAQLYPMVVRLFDEDIGRVVTQLLNLVECGSASTGQNIFNLVDQELQTLSIDRPWDNITAFGCDNASVMTGKDKGVISYVHKQNDQVVLAGCVCHLLHLAAKKGSKELEKDLDEVLTDIYFYLDKSAKRQKELQEFQRECGLVLSKILKHGATRWLSMARCIDRILEQWAALETFFAKEYSDVPEKKQNTKSFARLRRIQAFFSDSSSQLYCFFLQDLLKVFTGSSLMLQQDEPQIHKLKGRLNDLVEDLLVRFVKTEAIMAEPDIFSLKHGERINQMCKDDLLIGVKTREHYSTLKANELIDENQKTTFFNGVRSCLSEMTSYILKKLPMKDSVLDNARVLDVGSRGGHKVKMVEFFAKKFRTVGAEQAEALKREFSNLLRPEKVPN